MESKDQHPRLSSDRQAYDMLCTCLCSHTHAYDMPFACLCSHTRAMTHHMHASSYTQHTGMQIYVTHMYPTTVLLKYASFRTMYLSVNSSSFCLLDFSLHVFCSWPFVHNIKDFPQGWWSLWSFIERANVHLWCMLYSASVYPLTSHFAYGAVYWLWSLCRVLVFRMFFWNCSFLWPHSLPVPSSPPPLPPSSFLGLPPFHAALICQLPCVYWDLHASG